MDKDAKNDTELLIQIILYLLLALAFFSSYAIKLDTNKSNNIDFIIRLPFLFGFLSIFFLYIGLPLKNNYFNGFLKTLGYTFAFSFALTFGWFIFNVLALGQGETRLAQLSNILSISKSKVIWWAFLIPAIILISSLIIKEIKNRFESYLTSKINNH